MTTTKPKIIEYLDTEIYTARKRDFPSVEEFIAVLSVDLGIQSVPGGIKEGWQRWCVGNHDWCYGEINRGVYHLAFARIPRAAPVWVLDLHGDFSSAWGGECK